MKTFFRWLAILIVFAFIAASCGDDDDSSSDGSGDTSTEQPTAESAGSDPDGAATPEDSGSDDETEPTAEPDTGDADIPQGGSITMFIGSDAPGMDTISGSPSVAASTNTYFLLVYDQLVRVDAESNVEGRLAESVTSDDNLTWTVKLRPSLLFSDDTPFDAEALVFNWERFADPETGGRCVGDAGLMESFTATDEVTVEVVLAAANSQFPRLLQNCLGTIGSPTAITEKGADAFASDPVGAGPFVLEEWVRSDHADFSKNPNYWDAPRPYLDEFKVQIAPDQQQRYDTFKASNDSAIFLANVVSNHAFDLEAEGYEVLRNESFGGVSVGFNLNRTPFDDIRVRQAFAYAIDLDDINEKAAQGYGVPSHRIFPESSPFYHPSGETKTNDLAMGQALIDEYVAENGPIEVDFAVAQGIKPHGDAVTQQISRLDGVTINEQILDGALTVELLRNKDFDMIWTSGSGTYPDPPLFNFFHTNGSNSFGYSNPEMDAALESGRATTDADERNEAYKTAARLWVDEVPTIPIYQSITSTVVSKDVGGFSIYDLGYTDFSKLYIKG